MVATPVTETIKTTGQAGMLADHKNGRLVGMPADHVAERVMVGVSSGGALTDVPGGNRRSWQR